MLLEDHKSSSRLRSNELPQKWLKNVCTKSPLQTTKTTTLPQSSRCSVSSKKTPSVWAWWSHANSWHSMSPWAEGCKSSTKFIWLHTFYIIFIVYLYIIHYSQYYIAVCLSFEKKKTIHWILVKRKVSWRHSPVKRLTLPWQLLKLWNKQKNIRQIHVKKSLYNENIENWVKFTFVSSLFS